MSQAYTLITGATSGIGCAVAQRLASSRKLVLSGREMEKLETVRAECEAPDQHLLWTQDLAQAGAIADGLSSFLAARQIGIDHFVHCACIFEATPVQTVEMSGVTRIFTVNLFSAVEIIRVLASRRDNRGMLRSITFISGIAARLGTKGCSVLGATQGALNALARSLAVELAPAVRVNAVLPGEIHTSSPGQCSADAESMTVPNAFYPLGAGRAEDVADAVAFLISSQARWITGQELAVDGGRSIV